MEIKITPTIMAVQDNSVADRFEKHAQGMIFPRPRLSEIPIVPPARRFPRTDHPIFASNVSGRHEWKCFLQHILTFPGENRKIESKPETNFDTKR
jgi:hypothetical protein